MTDTDDPPPWPEPWDGRTDYSAPQREADTKEHEQEVPGVREWYEGKLRGVVDPRRQGYWRFHSHYDRDGYCDNPARGY